MLFLYTSLLKVFLRARFGALPGLAPGGESQGLVVVADGVGGFDLCGTALVHVLRALELPYMVKVVSWGHGLGRWHADLTNASNRDLRAGEIAVMIQNFRRDNPALPVFVVGKSGGTGLIVKALEHLPGGTVERAVLLAPALSPTYDLTAALAAVHREMVVFWSPLDVIVLGLGTRIFGTIDRIKSVSAGLVGFRGPAAAEADRQSDYGKLRQVRWRAEMATTGHLGGHVGTDNPAFLRKYVVPLLRVGEHESS
jgi:hypothetical protein